MKRIILGSRASKLAMIQAHWVIDQLHQHWPNLEISIEQIRTTGDRVTDVPLASIGGDGVFVTEIERALQEGRIDLAVHSLKDLPTVQPDGMRVVVTGPREDVRDAFIANMPFHISSAGIFPIASGMPQATALRIGTGSLRRTAQVRWLCPDADILPLRGNVDTRLRKLETGNYDGILLAAAGLHRLDLQESLAARLNYLPLDLFLPAPGQGALGLEIRDEPQWRELLAPLHDPAVQAATGVERMFMRHLGAGCYLPVAAYGEVVAGMLTVRGLVSSLDGQQRISLQQAMPWTPQTSIERVEQLGVSMAEEALALGAGTIITGIASGREQERQSV